MAVFIIIYHRNVLLLFQRLVSDEKTACTIVTQHLAIDKKRLEAELVLLTEQVSGYVILLRTYIEN